MTETVVHVTTLEQWKSVLDVWYKQGYDWPFGGREYSEKTFENGGRFLFLDDYITYSRNNPNSKPFIEYADFMSQQKEDNNMETYYVTQEQLDLIEDLKYENVYPIEKFNQITLGLEKAGERALLHYLGGDTSIKLKVKEQLYRLWRIDDDGDKVYLTFSFGTPDWDSVKDYAFTAPLEEIKKHKTISWEIEEAK